MFVRSKTVKGKVYHQAVRTYRDRKSGRIRHVTIASLGTHPTIEEAYRAAEERYFQRQGNRGDDASWNAWYRLERLERALRIQQGAAYRPTEAFQAEKRRRERAVKKSLAAAKAEMRAKRRAQKERQQRIFDKFLESLAGDDATPNTAVCSALLGLTPPFTVDQLKNAYRRKSRECHPDHGGPESAMKGVNLAYETLLKFLESRP
jgi:curved DNA-binding protein CbpA